MSGRRGPKFTPVKVGDHLEVRKVGHSFEVVIAPIQVNLTGLFPTPEDAIAAAREADSMCDFMALARGALDGTFDTRREQYRNEWFAIRTRHNGFARLDEHPVMSAEDIRQRLQENGIA